MKIKKQSGFTVIEGLLVMAVIVLLAASSWYFIHRHHNTKVVPNLTTQSNSTPPPVSPVPPSKSISLKSYSNTELGFSFKYPENWKLSVSQMERSTNGISGEIYVQSPNGTKVHFVSVLGGHGGDCGDIQAANYKHTTRTCTTHKVLSVNQIQSQKVWLLKASDTAPTNQGGKTTYKVYLSGKAFNAKGNLVAPYVTTNLGAWFGHYDVVTSKADIQNYFEGKDDSRSNTSAFFATNEVKEALPILESFRAQ